MPAAGSLAMLAAAAALCGSGPLEILLTNDDGAGATGLQSLRAGLVAAGHRVTVAAPDRNASGSAMGFTWSEVSVTRDPADPQAFAIGGSPATSVVLGATALYADGRRPDLVISGINHGPNSGALLMLSGTLGAALAATLLLDPPVPGVAVSADRLFADQPVDSAANRAQFYRGEISRYTWVDLGSSFLPSEMVAADGAIVFAGCDSDMMLCIDGASGEPATGVRATLMFPCSSAAAVPQTL